MKPPEHYILPSTEAFENDPLGYSALSWHRWAMLQTIAGFPTDPGRQPSAEELRSPVLWLCQAQALTEAAATIVHATPEFSALPAKFHGILDGQYRAAGLMLVGYSLEVCLKAMIIVREGVEGYLSAERGRLHHDLVKLADFVPALDDKDKAILRSLTHFVRWAGRYPAPKPGQENALEEVFQASETHKVSARDLFNVAARVMGHIRTVLETEDRQ